MKNLKILSSISMILLLAACSNSSYKPLSIDIPDNHKTAEIDILIQQHEINKDFIVSTGGQGFGLIGALIDAGVNQSRAEKAEEMVKELRNKMIDYDYDQEVKNTIAQSFSENAQKIEFSNVQVVKSLEELQKSTQETESALVITMPTSYRISGDGKSMIVDFHTNIFPKNKDIYQQLVDQNVKKYDVEELNLKDSFYRNVLILQKTLDNSADIDEVQALERWAENDAFLAKEALNQCISEGAKLIIEDISNFKEGVDYKYSFITSRNGDKLQGAILHEDDKMQVIRMSTGVNYVYF